MNIDVHRDRITITPTTPTEEEYIEQVLGLREEGDTCVCRRIGTDGAFSDSKIGCLEIIEGREEGKEEEG